MAVHLRWFNKTALANNWFGETITNERWFDELLEPDPGVAITASIAETQTAQTEAIVVAETYTVLLSESQASQTEAIVAAESYKVTLSESQAAQTESISVTVPITVSVSENQVAQTDSIDATTVVQKQTGWGGQSINLRYQPAVFVRETQKRQTDWAFVYNPGLVLIQARGEQKHQTDSAAVFQGIPVSMAETQAPQGSIIHAESRFRLWTIESQKRQTGRAEIDVYDETDDEEALVLLVARMER